MPSPTEIRQQITQQIVAALEADKVPWRLPWTLSMNAGRPTSVATGKAYSGINPLLLQLHASRHGFQSKWWATFNEWRRSGCVVKPRPSDVESGKWGCQIVFYKPVSKTVVNRATGLQEEDRFFLLRSYTVFNADQVTGEVAERLQVNQSGPTVVVPPDYEPVEQLIASTNADIRYGGNQALYARPFPANAWPNHSDGDFIQMPHRWQFPKLNEFYNVLLHELSHWTEVRRTWTGSYGMGELIAEMSAAFLSTELRLPQSEDKSNHAQYVKHWLEAMKADSSYIFRASTEASKAADLLLSFVRQPAGEAEKVPA